MEFTDFVRIESTMKVCFWGSVLWKLDFKNQSFQTYLILIYYDNNGKFKVEKEIIFTSIASIERIKQRKHDMDQREIGLNPTSSNKKLRDC